MRSIAIVTMLFLPGTFFAVGLSFMPLALFFSFNCCARACFLVRHG